MTKPVYEQTAADMDWRFRSGGFAAANGNIQGLIFALHALTRLLRDSPASADLLQLHTVITDGDRISGQRGLIYDYGCAQGDGTAFLSAMFPLSEIIGVDISPVAIMQASYRWPHIEFRVGDIRAPFDDRRASIIFTSHTLEHLEHPAKVVEGLRKTCDVLAAVFPPIDEDNEKLLAHVDAPMTKNWLPQTEPVWQTNYNTIRPDPEVAAKSGKPEFMTEGNILCLWTGL